MILLEVAVSVPVRQSYTYVLPEEANSPGDELPADLVGRRVYVPFGNRQVTGYVLELHDKEKPSFEVKEIIELLDESPLFHPDIVPLFRWISLYYHYPIGIVIKTALPAGLTVGTSRTIRLTNKKLFQSILNDQSFKPSDGWPLELSTDQFLSPAKSRKLLASSRSRKFIRKLVEQDCIIIEKTITQERIRRKFEVCYRLTQSEMKGQNEESAIQTAHAEQNDSGTSDRQNIDYSSAERKTIALLQDFSAATHCRDVPRKDLTSSYPYGAKVIKKLVEKGVVEIIQKRIYRSPLGDMLPYYDKPDRLSDDQVRVLQEITSVQEKQVFKTFLLHGITGSGKTEVYLQSAASCMSTGKTVLVLVPEIALAAQIEAHFVSRFGTTVALLHSGLTPGEKFDEWQRIASGQAQVVIGARSAVFAPLANLGLIVVDEEHDSSFKQEDSLRYNARDVAIVRARHSSCVVILGSATPSVTSFYHGLQGKYQLLKMDNRVGGRSLPSVSVVDLRKKRTDGSRRLFHERLQKLLEKNFINHRQSILLLNRRGFSTSIICQDCGSLVECRHCKVTMNYHKKRRMLLCHYCGYTLPISLSCPTCRSKTLQPVGFGTERVVEEVKALIPEAAIERVDSDISSDRKKFLSILQSVRDGEVDILVGTQMIAKGLHFPNVTLVGIVMADSGLAFPDYRSAEKTYQLIAQVTGRAGRGEVEGSVIIQSMQPEHYAIELAARHQYEALAEREISIRRQAGFPPFVRLAAIRIENVSEQRAKKGAQTIAAEARSWCRGNGQDGAITILGPAPAPIEKIRDFYRYHVLLKSVQIEALHYLLDHIENAAQQDSVSRITIDIDPENML